jgi:hypothetical protein
MKQDTAWINSETAALDLDNEDDEDDIVRLARIQALSAAARIAASSSSNHSNQHGNKSNNYKWTLPSLVSGGSVREEETLSVEEETESTVGGHESAPQQRRRRRTIEQQKQQEPSSLPPEENPAQFQPQNQPSSQNPIHALKAGWEGILEKSQHKLEEIQKDIMSKGVGVSHVSLRNQSQNNKYHGSNHENSNINTINATNTINTIHPSNADSPNPSNAVLHTSSPCPNDNIINAEMHHESHTTQDINTNDNPSPSHSKSVTLSTTTTTNTTNTTTTNTTTCTDSSQEPNILQTSIVWKRRSGYGKYSIRNAWEQRKLVLVGSTLQYFDLHTTFQENMEEGGGSEKNTAIDTHLSSVSSMEKEEEQGEDSNSNQYVPDVSIGLSIPSPAISPTLSQTKQKKDIRQLWEQAKENITQSIDGVKENFQYFDIANLKKDVVVPKNSHSDSSKQAMSSILPRGTMDLVQENAAIAVITVTDTNHKWSSNERAIHKLNVGTIHNSHPPTPFGLSIMVKGETKWKLCFETQKEQILWLALLTDIVVQRSVDSYNEELIKSSVSGGMITSTAVVSTTSTTSSIPPLPSLELTPTVSKTETVHSQVLRSPGDQKGALWQTESKYSLLHAVNTVDKTNDGPYPEKNPKLESILTSYDIHGLKESDSMEPYLIRKIHDWVNRFACKDPKISLSGLNLVFCGIFTNLMLLKAFVAESKITLCWLAMMMNFFIGMFILQDPTVSDTRRMRRKCFILDQLITSPSSTDQNRKCSDVKSPEEEKYLSEPPVIIRQGFKPNVGSTTLRVSNESDPNNVNGAQFIQWMPLDHQSVQVRSHGYLSSKKKIPAPASLYELVAVDICHSESQIRQFVKKVNLPSKMFFKDQIQRTWISPDVFVISLAVPTEEPSFSKSALDGGGITVVSIYKMREETRKVLKKITSRGYDASKCHEDFDDKNTMNAIKLFEKWCEHSPTNEKMQGRFKMIPNVHNINEVGLPSYISKYCGKPVLIKRVNVTGFLSNHPELNAMEFDITLHPFPYLAKKAMSYLYENIFVKAVISLSYVIEGRDDDELPEALIGDGVKLLRPDPAITVKALDLFNGTSKRSIDLIDTAKLS